MLVVVVEARGADDEVSGRFDEELELVSIVVKLFVVATCADVIVDAVEGVYGALADLAFEVSLYFGEAFVVGSFGREAELILCLFLSPLDDVVHDLSVAYG